MPSIITLDKALKLKELGVLQSAEFFYVWYYLIIDAEIYNEINRGNPVELNKLETIGTHNDGTTKYAIRYEKFSDDVVHFALLPDSYVTKVAAFNLEELIKLNAEYINIDYKANNYADFAADIYIENLVEVNQVFS